MRGIDKSQEVDAEHLLRDTRTLGQRIADFYKNPINVVYMQIPLIGICFIYPTTVDIVLILGVVMFIYASHKKEGLPVRLPLRAKMPDPNDLNPGTHKPMFGSGIAFFANDRKTQEEVWFKNDDMRTHVLIFGSTGSGKTEALASIGFNALIHASGFIYVDGKGDNSLFAKLFSMARAMGREDDVLLINFMTGARDIIGAQERRLSNTMNPFCTGSSSMLSQLVVSLMSGGSGGGDGDMWKGRAISFVEALMKILVYMRDQGAILLDANTIRNYFSLEKLEVIVIDKMFVRDEQEPVPIDDVPSIILEPLKNYVLNLPGYNKDKKGKQVSQVLEQHGFITMQLTRTFSSLADTYGHIIRTNLAEVDFKDVVLNRRILVVLLPALEKSPDELSNLGKIIIASLKAMMAAGLGDEVEGSYQDVIERKPTNSPSPFLCILDEYGYYAVEGFAVVPAQARSLGFSAIFAGQDLPAFQKASKEEAASIGANTNIKICMKLEDPMETWDFFNKTAGESYVTKVDSFQTKDGGISNTYMDAKSASFEKRARIDLLDLKEQTEGQAHIFFKSKIIRVSMFYANPKPVKQLRVNQFLRIEPPEDSLLLAMYDQTVKFKDILATDDFSLEHVNSPEMEVIFKTYDEQYSGSLIEQGVDVLLAFHNGLEEINVSMATEVEEKEQEGIVSLFSSLKIEHKFLEDMGVENIEEFSLPFINRLYMRKSIRLLERMSGRDLNAAKKMAQEVTEDFGRIVNYPSSGDPELRGEDFNISIKNVIDRVSESSL